MPLNRFDDLRSLEQVVAEQVRRHGPDAFDQMMQGVDLDLLPWSWSYTARPDQLAATEDDARVTGLVGGRGAGKTRTGGEWVRKRVGRGRKVRFALVGRTAGDVRDTMIQGESGILACFPPSEMPKYTPTARRIDFVDGSEALCYTAQEPSQLRGPQFHYGWGDEIAAWDLRPDDSGLNAWDNLQFATRLGKYQGIKAQVLFTTTPKRVKMLREIFKKAELDPEYSLYNQASTYDNIHLPDFYQNFVQGLYGGTRLADQEIYGVLGGDVDGALWSEQLIDNHRVDIDPGKLPIRVVGVDPTTADNPTDEAGIVVVGATPRVGKPLDRTAYVLADRTVFGRPKVWAKAAVDAAHEFDAYIVAEDNQGGAMVRDTIHGIDPRIKVVLVTSTTSKFMRAEPVAMATEQGRVKFLHRHAELEDQLVTWVPTDTNNMDSPDRMDAMVHALTGIVTIAKRKRGSGGTTRVRNYAKGRSLAITGGR